MPELTFELATQADDSDLRRLLRESSFPGSISLSFEREPNYFDASVLEGPFHQTIVARERNSGEVIAFANRSVRPVFVNGEVRNIGYLSQLRVKQAYRDGLYLARGLAAGFRKFRELDRDGRAPFYLLSIVEENEPAKRLLSSGLPGYPTVRPYTRMLTYAVYTVARKRASRLPGKLEIIQGSDTTACAIVEFLNRCNERRQFAPFWTTETLFKANLSPADFFLALDSDRMVGCIARWDQTPFKQTVVRGYSDVLGLFRKLLNLGVSLGFWPYLPPPGTPLRHAFACHLAIEGNSPGILKVLLRAVYNASSMRGDAYFVIGIPESSLYRQYLRPFRPIKYTSIIYLAGFGPGYEGLDTLDGRDPGLEIAIL